MSGNLKVSRGHASTHSSGRCLWWSPWVHLRIIITSRLWGLIKDTELFDTDHSGSGMRPGWDSNTFVHQGLMFGLVSRTLPQASQKYGTAYTKGHVIAFKASIYSKRSAWMVEQLLKPPPSPPAREIFGCVRQAGFEKPLSSSSFNFFTQLFLSLFLFIFECNTMGEQVLFEYTPDFKPPTHYPAMIAHSHVGVLLE